MVRYSVEPEVPEKVSKSRGSHLRIHFKHCREIAHVTKGMKVNKALKYLDDVLNYKAIVPFVKFTGGSLKLLDNSMRSITIQACPCSLFAVQVKEAKNLRRCSFFLFCVLVEVGEPGPIVPNTRCLSTVTPTGRICPNLCSVLSFAK